MLEYLHDNIKITDSTRESLYSYWRNFIIWGVENPSEMKFFNNFANTSFIEASVTTEVHEAFEFIDQIFIDGIKKKEIIDDNIRLLSILTYGSISSVIRFINEHDNLYDEALIEKTFKLFWRSIINL